MTGVVRSIGLLALTVASVVALALPLAPAHDAVAAGQRYDLSTWKDQDGQVHRLRWNPCQTITYAVNPKLAGGSVKARASAVADAKGAFTRMSRLTGIPVSYAGRTDEIPQNGASTSWADRQRAAEIVVAWVDQDRKATRTDLMGGSAGRYPSGVGGWMMSAWTGPDGRWLAAIGRGYVVINADHNRLYRRGYGSGMTRGALLLHEVGHAMGLNHVGTTRELMYPTMLERHRSTYKEGDRTGLAKVGRSLGCIPGANDVWPQI